MFFFFYICQCAKRWQEIQQTSAVSATLWHSCSDSRHLSRFLNSVLHFADEKESSVNATVPKDTIRSNSQSTVVKNSSSLDEQIQTTLDAGNTNTAVEPLSKGSG